MTLAIAPAPANTSTDAALPLVALPQTERLTVNQKANINFVTGGYDVYLNDMENALMAYAGKAGSSEEGS